MTRLDLFAQQGAPPPVSLRLALALILGGALTGWLVVLAVVFLFVRDG